MKEAKKKRKIILINTIIVLTVLSIVLWLGIEEYKDSKIESEKSLSLPYNIQNLNVEQNVAKETKEENTKVYPKETVIEEYRGYQVGAKLEIPSIELETYVLQKYSQEALNISVTKFWGVNANQIGNFCIAGHNYGPENMFQKIKNLNINDEIYLTDINRNKMKYTIYDIYTVLPNDTKCLSQRTKGEIELTLITCTFDSEKRIIIKARA